MIYNWQFPISSAFQQLWFCACFDCFYLFNIFHTFYLVHLISVLFLWGIQFYLLIKNQRLGVAHHVLQLNHSKTVILFFPKESFYLLVFVTKGQPHSSSAVFKVLTGWKTWCLMQSFSLHAILSCRWQNLKSVY